MFSKLLYLINSCAVWNVIYLKNRDISAQVGYLNVNSIASIKISEKGHHSKNRWTQQSNNAYLLYKICVETLRISESDEINYDNLSTKIKIKNKEKDKNARVLGSSDIPLYRLCCTLIIPSWFFFIIEYVKVLLMEYSSLILSIRTTCVCVCVYILGTYIQFIHIYNLQNTIAIL